MAKVLLILVIAFGLYEIATMVIVLPSRQTLKATKRLVQKHTILQDLKDLFVTPIATFISKFIKLDRIKREKLRKDLERVDIQESPEMYYANAITISLLMCLGSLFLIPLGMKIITAAAFLLAIAVYFANVERVKEKIKETNEAIKRELPRFVRMYNHSRGDNIQFVDIAEKYRQIAGDKFKYDLDLLIMDLKTGNEENALLNFAERVNIPQMTSFVNVVLGAIKGDNVSVSLQLMEGEMKILARENKRRIMQERPGKVKRATIATGIMLLVMYFFVLGKDLISNTAFF
jgi:pilus assembly protein TadC